MSEISLAAGGIKKQNPHSFPPFLFSELTCLCVLVAAQRKSSISDDRSSSQAQTESARKSKQRHGRRASPAPTRVESHSTTWRTLFTPSFALEWSYGLVSCFYTILARTDWRDSSSRTICTCSLDFSIQAKELALKGKKELLPACAYFFRVNKNIRRSPLFVSSC